MSNEHTPHYPGLTHLPTKRGADALRKELDEVRDLLSGMARISDSDGDKEMSNLVFAVHKLTGIVEVILSNQRREAIVSEGKL